MATLSFSLPILGVIFDTKPSDSPGGAQFSSFVDGYYQLQIFWLAADGVLLPARLRTPIGPSFALSTIANKTP